VPVCVARCLLFSVRLLFAMFNVVVVVVLPRFVFVSVVVVGWVMVPFTLFYAFISLFVIFVALLVVVRCFVVVACCWVVVVVTIVRWVPLLLTLVPRCCCVVRSVVVPFRC